MEAIFFRFLARELASVLVGSRVDKVYMPSPNCLTLALYIPAGGLDAVSPFPKRQYLHLHYGTGHFFCFLAPMKTAQPERAPAEAMRLRKHLGGRRVIQLVDDWPNRRLFLGFSGEGPALLLDPRAAPALVAAFPDAKPAVPDWPSVATVLAEPEIWRAHPQFSPELRRRLAALPREQASALVDRLQHGVAEGFFVEFRRGMPEAVWPVSWPDRLQHGREVRRYDSALAAAVAFGQPLAFGEVTGRQDAPEAAAKAVRARRLARSLARLDADEARMRSFIARRADADALAASLHRLDGRIRQPAVEVTYSGGGEASLFLDPALTVIQNMQKLYHLAAKGERGLIAIAARRRDLQDGKKTVQGPVRGGRLMRPDRFPPGPYAGVAAHRYRTSDGFLALRGRNAKANDQLLRLANAFDLWFHVADGPGAHVIVRRDHPGREVPRRSLLEAAGLAALASYAGQATTATVLVALVADVRRIRGAAAGRVAVTSVLETLRVRPAPELEKLRETP